MESNIIDVTSIINQVPKSPVNQKTTRWAEMVYRVKLSLSRLLSKLGFPCIVRPFEYTDQYTGNHIKITDLTLFTKISINGRDYYFHRLSGKFDGTGSGCV